jgi:hypothetical protein
VATFVREAALVVTVLNGIAVLAEALDRPILLLPLGQDPCEVVGPVGAKPLAVLETPRRLGVAGIDMSLLSSLVAKTLESGG